MEPDSSERLAPSPAQRLVHLKDPGASQPILTVFLRRASDSRGPWTFPSLPGLLFSLLEWEFGAHSRFQGESSLQGETWGHFLAGKREQMESSSSCSGQTPWQPGRIWCPSWKPVQQGRHKHLPPLLPPFLPSGLYIFRAYSAYAVKSASSPSLLEMERYGSHLPFTEWSKIAKNW